MQSIAKLQLLGAALLLVLPFAAAGGQHFHEESDDVAQIALVINAGTIRYAVTHPSSVEDVGDDFRFSLAVTGPAAITAGQSTITLQAVALHGCTAPAGAGDFQDTGSTSNAAGTGRSITQRFVLTEKACSGTYRVTLTAGGSGTVISDRFITFSVTADHPTAWDTWLDDIFEPLLWILFFWAVTMRMVLGGGIRYGFLWLFALIGLIIILLDDAVPGWPMSATLWGLGLGIVVLSLANRFGTGDTEKP